MNIRLTNIGKRFNRDWIFRDVNHIFQSQKAYAITGPNGSGKSTLLQVIAGNMDASKGACEWEGVAVDTVYQYISIVAPYLELIEEMTAKEFLAFHASFKPLLQGTSIDRILEEVQLANAANKQIRYYSSGMKQRIKLAQAIFSDTPVLLLDEPCTNLDVAGYALYHHLINTYCTNKLVIVSSNDEQEMSFCKERISILDYK